MAKSDLDKRMAERRARVAAAKARSGIEEAVTPEPEEDPDDYWTLPKVGGPTTILNSAWTWTLVIYVIIIGSSAISVLQSRLIGTIDSSRATLIVAIAIAMIYPAWRGGYLISKYLKRRNIGSSFSITGTIATSTQGARTGKTPKAGSVEERMAKRRARVEKARQEGKL